MVSFSQIKHVLGQIFTEYCHCMFCVGFMKMQLTVRHVDLTDN